MNEACRSDQCGSVGSVYQESADGDRARKAVNFFAKDSLVGFWSELTG